MLRQEQCSSTLLLHQSLSLPHLSGHLRQLCEESQGIKPRCLKAVDWQVDSRRLCIVRRLPTRHWRPLWHNEYRKKYSMTSKVHAEVQRNLTLVHMKCLVPDCFLSLHGFAWTSRGQWDCATAGTGNVDDDGFQRQGRGSGKAWGPSARGDQPAAARPNAWAQGSSTVRVRPPSPSPSPSRKPDHLACQKCLTHPGWCRALSASFLLAAYLSRAM